MQSQAQCTLNTDYRNKASITWLESWRLPQNWRNWPWPLPASYPFWVTTPATEALALQCTLRLSSNRRKQVHWRHWNDDWKEELFILAVVENVLVFRYSCAVNGECRWLGCDRTCYLDIEAIFTWRFRAECRGPLYKDGLWLCQWSKLHAIHAFWYIPLLLGSSLWEAEPSDQLLVSWVYTLRSNTEQPDCLSYELDYLHFNLWENVLLT